MSLDLNYIFEFLKGQLHTNPFFAGATLTGAIASVVYWFRAKFVATYNRIRSFFRVSLTIHSEDDLYIPVTEWLKSNGFDAFSRNYRVRYEDGKPVYGPSQGTFWFFYNRRPIRVTLAAESTAGAAVGGRNQTREFLTISYYHFKRSAEMLNSVIDHAAEKYREMRRRGIPVYTHKGNNYQLLRYLPRREKTSVVLAGDTLEQFEADIKLFLKRKDWYLERGVPYHRGYLLTGPPGTGKTSVVRHLAQKFEMQLCVSDGSINSIRGAYANGILLMEDVDSIAKMRDAAAALLQGIGETSNANKPATVDEQISNMHTPTLSELLNALDGVASAEGTIVIMTTNHPEVLDPAMLRPGRIDRTFYLGHCTAEQAVRLFIKFYGEDYAKEFQKVAPEGRYTPAQLQELFVSSPMPTDAIAAIRDGNLETRAA
jgi:chaperone BCS1